MKKVSFVRTTILISIFATSSLILGIATAFYYVKYEQVSRTYARQRLFNCTTGVPQVFITYPAGFEEYAAAILKICEVALSKYVEVFGMSTPDIHVFICIASEDLISELPWIPFLYHTDEYRIFNYLRSIDDYRPPPAGVAHHIYGFIHEIGHLVFMMHNIFAEGWADYAAGFRIVSEVYRELGYNVWPQPYNYSKTEGKERFLEWINDPSICKPNTFCAAGKILYTIDQKYGPTIFKSAIDKMHPTYVGMYRRPIYELEEFKSVLVDLTNDTSLLELFSANGF